MKKQIILGVAIVILLMGCFKIVRAESTPQPVEIVVERVEIITCPQCFITEDDAEPVFELSDAERRVVECIVMGEAEGESWDGKVLVAQCILNACLKDNIQPSEVREKYKYSGWNENPDNEATTAVVAVFDDGHKITNEPILWFYAPKYVKGTPWHETQRYVLTEGGHKFFAPWED